MWVARTPLPSRSVLIECDSYAFDVRAFTMLASRERFPLWQKICQPRNGLLNLSGSPKPWMRR
jgi:hypothetical protein